MGKMKVEDPISVRIDLPLATDVVATLVKIVGLTYPKTVLADDGHTWKHERQHPSQGE